MKWIERIFLVLYRLFMVAATLYGLYVLSYIYKSLRHMMVLGL